MYRNNYYNKLALLVRSETIVFGRAYVLLEFILFS